MTRTRAIVRVTTAPGDIGRKPGRTVAHSAHRLRKMPVPVGGGGKKP
jgi:hypothetical protein